MLNNFMLYRSTPPNSWSYLTAFLNSATWAVPQTGWYRVFCIGKSGDGGSEDITDTENPLRYVGRGGGGSGGMAVSNILLSAGQSISVTITSGISRFMDMVGGAGSNGTIQIGGDGGTASGGNVANYDGFKGGNGGPSSDEVYRLYGETGGNGGMRGGRAGYTLSGTQPGGGGGGGGARLPGSDICLYISPVYTSQYSAGSGGNGSGSYADGENSTSYPSITLNTNMVLFGGGGGRGGRGSFSGGVGTASNGTPAIVIIEKGSN